MEKFAIKRYVSLIKNILPNRRIFLEPNYGGFIKEDWQNVGDDLWSSIDKYEQEREKQ